MELVGRCVVVLWFYRAATLIYRLSLDSRSATVPVNVCRKNTSKVNVMLCLRRPEEQSSSALNGVQLPLVFIFFAYFSTKIP